MEGGFFFRTGRCCLHARVLHSAASHTACVVRRNLLSPQWTVALTRQTSQDFARAIRIDLAQQKTLASVASSRRIRPRGRLAARPNCVFSPSLRRHSSQIAHPGQLRVLWSQPKVRLEEYLFLGYLRLNQTKTKPCSISRDRFLPTVQLPACFVPRRALARTDGPRRGPLQGPLQRPLEGLGGRRGGWAAGRAGGLKGTWGTQGGPGEARGGQGGPGGARGRLGKPGEAARGGPGPRGKIRGGPGRPGATLQGGPGGPGRARGSPGGPWGAQGARRAKPRALHAVRRSACVFAWPARTTPTTRVQLVPELVGRATQLVQLKKFKEENNNSFS